MNASMIAASETGTAPPALALLNQAGLLPVPPLGSNVLDSAATGGNLTARLREGLAGQASRVHVVTSDLKEEMVNFIKTRIEENKWEDTEALVADANKLPFPDSHFTHSLMNFGPQLMQTPLKVMQESHRVLKSGGVHGSTCWTKSGWVPSVQAVFPTYAPPPTLANSWSTPEFAETQLTEIGFKDIKITTYTFETNEANLEAYLELMRFLLAKLFAGRNGEKYEAYMREKYGSSPVKMEWECMVVTATKP